MFCSSSFSSFTCASCPLSMTAFLASAFNAKNSVSASPASSCFALGFEARSWGFDLHDTVPRGEERQERATHISETYLSIFQPPQQMRQWWRSLCFRRTKQTKCTKKDCEFAVVSVATTRAARNGSKMHIHARNTFLCLFSRGKHTSTEPKNEVYQYWEIILAWVRKRRVINAAGD